jgi:hypothetical protein
MTPAEIQKFVAKRRAKAAGGAARKFKTHIDPRSGRPHEPRNHAEATRLIDLATVAQDDDAASYYADEIMSGRLP